MSEPKNIQFINLQKDQQAQTMANIKQLQTMEKNLYAQIQQLALSPNEKTAAKQEIIIKRINDLSHTRQLQFNNLKNEYGFLQENVSRDRTELVSQLTVLGVVEKDLNNAKARLNEMKDMRNSKMRLIEINTYYGKRYASYAGLMKIIFVLCIFILLLTIIHKKKYIPDSISNALIVIILVVGLYFLLRKIIDMYGRDNMNYDEFDFGGRPEMRGGIGGGGETVIEYDENQLDLSKKGLEADFKGLEGEFGKGCIDAACCTTGGLTYDKKTKRCVLKTQAQRESFITGQLTTTTPFVDSGELTQSGAGGKIQSYNFSDSDKYATI